MPEPPDKPPSANDTLHPTSSSRSGSSSWTVGNLAQRWRVTDDELSPRYREGTELGRGGMGVVRLAFDKRLRRDVAVKSMRVADEGGEMVLRFLTEAQVTGQLTHPNIPPIHDLGIGPGGTAFFTMKALPGRNLKKLLKEEGALAMPRALELFGKICDAVAFAHSKGVLHRDLKPANVIIGDFGEVYVIDWGLAKKLGADAPIDTEGDDSGGGLTERGVVIGTPGYMSPEQAAGAEDLDERSDVYALGALLFALFTGRSAFKGRGAKVLLQVHQGDFPRPRKLRRDLPWELEQVVLKAMHLRPDGRYASVVELQEDLAAWQERRALPGISYGMLRRVGKVLARNQTMLIRSIVGLAVVGSTSLVVLAGYAVTVVWARDRALDAERQAQEARDLAEGRALDLQVAMARLHAELGASGQARSDLQDAIERAAVSGRDDRPARFHLAELDATYPPPQVRIPSASSNVLAPQGDRIAVRRDRDLFVHDALSGRLLSSWEAPGEGRVDMAPFRDDELPVWVREGEELVRYDGASGQRKWAMALPGLGDADKLVLSRDETVLAWSTEGRARFLAVPGGEVFGPEADLVVTVLSADGSRAIGHRREGGPHRQLEDHEVIEVVSGQVLGGYHGMERALAVPDLSRIVTEVAEGAEAIDLDGTVAWSGGPGFSEVALSADASSAVMVSTQGIIEVRDVVTGEVQARRQVGDAPVGARNLFPQMGSGWVAAVVEDATHVWSVAGRPTASAGHEGAGLGIDSTADGVLLATTGWEGDVVVWDWRSGAELGRWRICDQGVRDVSFSPNGGQLATADRAGLVHIIDLETWTVGPPLDAGRGIAMGVEWLDDGALIVGYEDGRMVRWEAGQPGDLMHEGLNTGWAMDRAGDFLVVAGRDGGDPFGELWNVRTGERVGVTQGEGIAYGATVMPDGETWAVGTHDGRILVVADGVDRVLRDDLDEPVMGLAFSADGGLIAAGTLAGGVFVHDAASGEELLATTLGHGGIQDMHFVAGTSVLLTHGGAPGTWTWLDLDLTERFRATQLTLVPGEDPEPDWAAAAERAELRRDWRHAALALQHVDDVSPLRLARALHGAGDLEGARAALRRTDASVLPGTQAAWRAAIAEGQPK